MLLTWPRQLISARTVTWRLETPGQPLPASFRGTPQSLFTSGGPFWRLTVSGLIMRGRQAIAAGNALKLNLGAGERPILIAPCDCRQAPLAAGFSLAGDVETDASPFSGFSALEASPIEATIRAAALRATIVTLDLVAGARPLIAGDRFTVPHATWKQRRYVIAEVTGGTDLAPQVRIRPPLREDVAGGTAVDFNRAPCVMRLDGSFDTEQTVPGQLHVGSASFCELERAPSGAGL